MTPKSSGHTDGFAAERSGVGVVCDEDEGAVSEAGADARDEEAFGLDVKGRRRLVEQQDAAGAQEGAGDRYALCLAFAQACAAFSAECIEAFRQVVDEFCDCCMEGVAHLFFCRVSLAHQEVVTDGAADQGVALRDVDDVAAGARRCLDLFCRVVV